MYLIQANIIISVKSYYDDHPHSVRMCLYVLSNIGYKVFLFFSWNFVVYIPMNKFYSTKNVLIHLSQKYKRILIKLMWKYWIKWTQMYFTSYKSLHRHVLLTNHANFSCNNVENIKNIHIISQATKDNQNILASMAVIFFFWAPWKINIA